MLLQNDWGAVGFSDATAQRHEPKHAKTPRTAAETQSAASMGSNRVTGNIPLWSGSL